MENTPFFALFIFPPSVNPGLWNPGKWVNCWPSAGLAKEEEKKRPRILATCARFEGKFETCYSPVFLHVVGGGGPNRDNHLKNGGTNAPEFMALNYKIFTSAFLWLNGEGGAMAEGTGSKRSEKDGEQRFEKLSPFSRKLRKM